MKVPVYLRPAQEAFAHYWKIILSFQFMSFCLVIAYYQSNWLRAGFLQIAEWKHNSGLLFVILTTIASGLLLPDFFKRLFLPSTRSLSPREWLHQLILWAVIGLLVDHFYQFQAHFIGQEANALNVLAKILLDQFVFAPFIILPFIVIWFALDEATYRPKIWLQSLNVRMICRRVAPIWCTSLCYWPLMLVAIYALPSDLQFPLFLLVNAAYSVLMIYIAKKPQSLSKDCGF
jgi:hypothetical protein